MSAAAVLALAAAFAHPLAGVPAAAGVAAFVAVRFSRPDQVLRGRTLSPARQRQAAALAGLAMLGLAGLFSGAIAALQLAIALESRLNAEIDAAQKRGGAKLDRTFEACAAIACARATTIQLPRGHRLGLAGLSGFVWHKEAAFGWRDAAAHGASMVRPTSRCGQGASLTPGVLSSCPHRSVCAIARAEARDAHHANAAASISNDVKTPAR